MQIDHFFTTALNLYEQGWRMNEGDYYPSIRFTHLGKIVVAQMKVTDNKVITLLKKLQANNGRTSY